jgi:hypothetical protein
MNRRELAVNVLIGSALLLILFAVFAGGFGAIGLAFYLLNASVKHFFPALVRREDLVFYALICIWSLIKGIGHLRKRRLTNAFLSLAMIPSCASVGLADPHSPLQDNSFFIWPLLLVMLILSDSPLTRLEFMLGGFVVSATIAVNAGLLGTGTLAQVTTDSVFVSVIAVIAIYFRRKPRRGFGQQPPSPTSA